MNKKTFHHGDLHNSLIELALAELEKVGCEQLSLRELAKTLGVSRAAPYRHFESKEALLRTLAGIGLEQLGAAYMRVADIEKNPTDRLRAACCAYMDFASKNPELYRLIFSGDLDWKEIFAASADAEGEEISLDSPKSSFGFFERLVADALGSDDPKKVRSATLISWSMMPGSVKLKLDGMLGAFTDENEFESVLLDVASNAKRFKV